MRQQMFDQISLARAEPVALAAPEERALCMGFSAVVRRIATVAGRDHHRSV
jgi:hypothetical protein